MRASLSTFNFRINSRKTRIILSVIVFCAVVWLSNRFFTYILARDDLYSSFTRVTLHELYHPQDNIDILFLGSSHSYRAINTRVTDEGFNANTFNAGTSCQYLDGSYALLVEAGKRNQLQRVYVEMYYSLTGMNHEDRTELTSTYQISDNMKTSVNKFRFLLNGCGKDYWINGLVPARRNWQKLFKKGYVAETIAAKRTPAYIDYEWPSSEKEYYAGKGYIGSDVEAEDNVFVRKGGWGTVADNVFAEDDIESLEKIIQYCDKNGIELVLYSAPMTDFRVADLGNYDHYIEQVNSFLADKSVKYYDFNLCREKYFSCTRENFSDHEHINTVGAEKFSELFAAFFTGKITEEELFYDSYANKMESMEAEVYGLCYAVEEQDEHKSITFRTVRNKEQDVRYCVYSRNEAEEYEQIADMMTRDSAVVSVEEQGQLRVDLYGADGEALIGSYDISY